MIVGDDMGDMKDLFSSEGEHGVALGALNMDGSIICANSAHEFMTGRQG